MTNKVEKRCAYCGESFKPKHGSLKYCSPLCRHRQAWDQRKLKQPLKGKGYESNYHPVLDPLLTSRWAKYR